MKLLLVVIVLLCGCSTTALTNITQGAHLYDNKGEVTNAKFTWQGTSAGSFVITRGDEHCTGEHSTLVDGVDTKSFLASLTVLRASSSSALVGQTATLGGTPTFGAISTANKVQRGLAVAICPSNEIITCQYSMNIFQRMIVGYGTCTSSKPVSYQLIFS